MFGRKTDPEQRRLALDLLVRWYRTISEIDSATDKMRITMTKEPLGMQSDAFENERLESIKTVERTQKLTNIPSYWPVLSDNEGARLEFQLKEQLESSYSCQLNLLNLYGQAGYAFRRGANSEAPSMNEMRNANLIFDSVLTVMGKTAAKLARHYQISGQEYQRSIQR